LWQQSRDSFEDNGIWYCKSALGKNTLADLMRRICKICKMAKYNNQSIRATQFASRDIMKVSGHKSETSIKTCSSKTSDDKLEKNE
jgi:hypothetical protein